VKVYPRGYGFIVFSASFLALLPIISHTGKWEHKMKIDNQTLAKIGLVIIHDDADVDKTTLSTGDKVYAANASPKTAKIFKGNVEIARDVSEFLSSVSPSEVKLQEAPLSERYYLSANDQYFAIKDGSNDDELLINGFTEERGFKEMKWVSSTPLYTAAPYAATWDSVTRLLKRPFSSAPNDETVCLENHGVVTAACNHAQRDLLLSAATYGEAHSKDAQLWFAFKDDQQNFATDLDWLLAYGHTLARNYGEYHADEKTFLDAGGQIVRTDE
jgi:hypothetical protein